MIVIDKPRMESKEKRAIISVQYSKKDSAGNRLWFSVPQEYEEYLTVESLDAFVVALLLLAMNNGKDMRVNGPMSRKLFYQLTHYLIPALNLAIPELKPIKIEASGGLTSKDFNRADVAGTGMSLGIDSLSTFVEHLDCEPGFKVEYFTFCNVGSSHIPQGSFAKSSKLFEDRLTLVKSFSDQVGIPLISIDSNMHQICPIAYFRTHTIRTAAFALIFQKLFRSYHYSSAYRFDYFKLDSHDTSKYDQLLLPMLSTESTTFYSSSSQYTRVERTRIISDYAQSYTHLNVCASPASTGKLGGKNCSVCKKCLRTQLTLDLLGRLHRFSEVFDLSKYQSRKNEFIGYCLYHQKSNPILREIIELMENTGNRMPLSSRLYYLTFAILDKIPESFAVRLRSAGRKFLVHRKSPSP